MKKIMYSIAVVTSLLFVSCGGEAKPAEDGHEGHDHSEVVSDKYYCPMKCEGEKTYDEKGECPVCHMDLVK